MITPGTARLWPGFDETKHVGATIWIFLSLSENGERTSVLILDDQLMFDQLMFLKKRSVSGWASSDVNGLCWFKIDEEP